MTGSLTCIGVSFNHTGCICLTFLHCVYSMWAVVKVFVDRQFAPVASFKTSAVARSRRQLQDLATGQLHCDNLSLLYLYSNVTFSGVVFVCCGILLALLATCLSFPVQVARSRRQLRHLASGQLHRDNLLLRSGEVL